MFKKIMPILLFCSFILTGCWDQIELKNIRMPTVVGFDSAEEKTKAMAIIRIPLGTSMGQTKSENEKITSTGDTLNTCFEKWLGKTSGGIEFSQIHVMVMGEDYAKDKFSDLINAWGNRPKSSFSMTLAVAEGKADDILKLRKDKTPLLDEYIGELIQSGISLRNIPESTLKIVHTKSFDPGIDNILPFIKKSKQKGYLQLSGVALMAEDGYSGKSLSPELTRLLLAFMGEKNSKHTWTANKDKLKKILVSVRDSSTDKTFKGVKEGKETVDIQMTLKVDIKKYTRSGVKDKKELNEIAAMFSKYYTEKAEKLFEQLKEADCDALGIGREMMAFHQKSWEQIKSKDYYRNVEIKPTVKVEIVEANLRNP